MIKNKTILIYGANGFTGKLFTKHLLEKGIFPVLAGRNKTIHKLAKKCNCEARIFTTKESSLYLSDIDIVINLASISEHAQEELLKACMVNGSHYIDINSDIHDLRNVIALEDEIIKSKIVVISGAGFGVAPTAIAAQIAADEIDNPTSLTIAYHAEGKFSRGLKKYFLNTLNRPGYIVKNGKLKPAVAGCKTINFNVFGVDFTASYNPWRSDILSSFRNTKIKNIESYSAFSPLATSMMEGKREWLRKVMIKRLMNFIPKGPSEEDMHKGKTFIKAIVSNNEHEQVSVEIMGPDSNIFTIECLYELMIKLTNEQRDFGVKSPASFGSGILGRVSGVKIFSKYEKKHDSLKIFDPVFQ